MHSYATRHLQINGGRVTHHNDTWLLTLPSTGRTYADAQIDDYGASTSSSTSRRSRAFRWRPPLELSLSARFSHPTGQLLGTAGFGFWNAPFGDPTVRLSLLPQATWFFYASPPADLPLAPNHPGQGWFASTLDAGTWPALTLAPLAPAVLLLNRLPRLKPRLWPAVQHRLGISYTQLNTDLTTWHDYHLIWRPTGCDFYVDNTPILQTPHSPRGPLGFVCWLDNQYMIATPTGRFAAGLLPTPHQQWLELKDLTIHET